MARRKGGKIWDGISRGEWLRLFGDPEIMTDLMMDIFYVLYEKGHGEDRAKNIALALDMDYRGLNAAVGQAGVKIREWYASAHGADLSKDAPCALKMDMPEEAAPVSLEEAGETDSSVSPAAGSVLSDGEKEQIETPRIPVRAPWEYVFDGTEEADGTYLWIMKPAAFAAWAELTEAAGADVRAFRHVLAEDVSSYQREGSLFAASPKQTVNRIRVLLEKREALLRRSRRAGACCAVCGTERISLLRPESYGVNGDRQKGLFFCPTHGALFRAHVISFSEKETLLVSDTLTDEERQALGLVEGAKTKASFSKRRMADHRRIFKEREREN